MAKYDQLVEHLDNSGSDEVTLTFAEVDVLVEGLPPSAYERAEWWANDSVGHVQSRAWLSAGWRVVAHDRTTRTVTFRRKSADGTKRVRNGPLQRAVLEILAEKSPVGRSEVLTLLLDRIAMTPYELEPAGKNGAPRFQSFVTWGSTEMRAAGWLDKSSEGWAITETGRQVLADIDDPDDFATLSRAAWKEVDDRRKAQEEYRRPAFGIVEAAIGVLEPGEWTSYTEIAELAGIGASQVGDFIRVVRQESGHRVIQFDGRPYGNYPWFGEGVTPRTVLEQEGVRFDEHGVADPRQRVTTEDLRDRLEPLSVLPSVQKRAWLVRGSSVNGRDLIPVWRDQGSVSLPATKLRRLEEGLSRDELKPVVEEDYSQASYAAKAAKVDEFHAFLSRMQVGDLVATTSQGRLFLGTITGEPKYVSSEDGRSNLRRSVDWLEGQGVDYSDVPSEVSARLQVQHEVVEMTQQMDQLEQMLDEPRDLQISEPEPVVELDLPDATEEISSKLNVGRNWLQESIQLLRDHKQLIYYGPPGTGKTYVALKLAEHLAGDNVRLVQFHPAYTYEDFFEGYRPVPSGAFELKPGPLRKIVDQAKDNPSTPYFLIIDEINRGNLAKIFGELYFLLEYRDREIDLLYATDDDIGFTLPKNVFIIGTMNTADRSIALVDSAMRRRFAFEALHPSVEPTAGLLRRWLKAEGLPGEAAHLLDVLNSQIEDPDFKIGPSYFMKTGGQSAEGLARTWRTSILPLLEEHHFGELSSAEVEVRYGLDKIRARAGQAALGASDVASADLVDDDSAPDPH